MTSRICSMKNVVKRITPSTWCPTSYLYCSIAKLAEVGKSAERLESRNPQLAKGHQERYCRGASCPLVGLLSAYSTSEISFKANGARRPLLICSSPYCPVKPPVERSSARSIVCTRKVRGASTPSIQLAAPRSCRT